MSVWVRVCDWEIAMDRAIKQCLNDKNQTILTSCRWQSLKSSTQLNYREAIQLDHNIACSRLSQDQLHESCRHALNYDFVNFIIRKASPIACVLGAGSVCIIRCCTCSGPMESLIRRALSKPVIYFVCKCMSFVTWQWCACCEVTNISYIGSSSSKGTTTRLPLCCHWLDILGAL